MKRAEGWELSFLFFFKRAFFNGWGGEGGGDATSIPNGFFFLPLWKGNGEVFLFKCRTFSMRGCFLIDMREGRGLVVSKCKG